MGYVPIVSFPIRQCPEGILRERMKGRTSHFRSKRTYAILACRELIRRAEIEFGWREEEKLAAPPKPSDALRSVIVR
jgi:hypothetical protein